MDGGRRTACKGCGQEVFWRTLEPSGSRMALDPTPHEDAVVRLVPPAGARVLNTAELEALDPDVPLYRPHFATCSKAAEFRTPKPGRRPSDPNQGTLL